MNLSRYFQFWKEQFKGTAIIAEHLRSIFAINFKALKKDHRLVVFDYDDTLTTMHGQLGEQTLNLFKEIQALGYQIGVVSNCSESRYHLLDKVFAPLGIYISPNRNKPSPMGFLDVCAHYQIAPEYGISVGDRLGTECFGAFLAGFDTIILIDKYSNVFTKGYGIFILNWMDALERKLYFSKHK